MHETQPGITGAWPFEDSRESLGLDLAAGLDALIARARKAEHQPPRQHHLVPSSYLQRWAVDGKIRVTEVDEAKSWLSSPTKAARERDYYSLGSPDLNQDEVPPLLMETLLSEVESIGIPSLGEVARSGRSGANREAQTGLAMLMAFQFVRGERVRQELRDLAQHDLQVTRGGLTEDGVRELLSAGGQEPTTEEIQQALQDVADLNAGVLVVEPQRAALAAMQMHHAEKIAVALLGREWCVVNSRAALVTTDEPVVVIGGPGCSRVVSAGLDDAAVVVFPLGPSQVLAMFKPGRLPGRAREDLTASETHELNTELIAASSRFAFEQPSRAVARRLPVPRGHAGRVLRDEFAVRGSELRRVVAFHVETRWAGASKPPPWPVSRWYRS